MTCAGLALGAIGAIRVHMALRSPVTIAPEPRAPIVEPPPAAVELVATPAEPSASDAEPVTWSVDGIDDIVLPDEGLGLAEQMQPPPPPAVAPPVPVSPDPVLPVVARGSTTTQREERDQFKAWHRAAATTAPAAAASAALSRWLASHRKGPSAAEAPLFVHTRPLSNLRAELSYPTNKLTESIPEAMLRAGPSTAVELGRADGGSAGAAMTIVLAASPSATALHRVSLDFAPLRSAESTLAPSALRCVNCGMNISANSVRTLVLVVAVPAGSAAGTYSGSATLTALRVTGDAAPHDFAIDLHVRLEVPPAGGDECSEPTSQASRLKWLARRDGDDGQPVRPYVPLTVDAGAIHVLGRTLVPATTGLNIFSSLRAGSRELLAAPAAIILDAAGAPDATWRRTAGEDYERLSDDGVHHWGWVAENSACARARLACRAEYDGYVECVLTASTSQPECGPLRFDDIGVTLPLRAGEVPYAAGAWLRSGLRPQKEYVWKWSPSFPRGGGHAPGMGESGGVWDNFAWLGSVEAGVQLRLKPASDSENMLAWKLMRPYPAGWHNDGRGGLRIAAPSDRGVVRLTAFTGARTVSVPLELRFSFMLTPVKPLSPAALFGPEMRRWHVRAWDPPTAAKLREVRHAISVLRAGSILVLF